MESEVFMKLKVIVEADMEIPKNIIIKQTVESTEPVWDQDILSRKFAEATDKIEASETKTNDKISKSPITNSSTIANEINLCRNVVELCVEFLSKDAEKWGNFVIHGDFLPSKVEN